MAANVRNLDVVLAVAVAAVLSAACVGPNFHRPAAPAGAGYAPTPWPERTAAAPVAGGESQRFAGDHPVGGRWWREFGSEPLDALVERALARNPTIRAAQAALRQAQELELAQRGFFYPALGLGYAFERQKVAGNLSNSVAPGVQGNGTVIAPVQNPSAIPHNQPLYYNFHTAQLSVGYTPDVFGANARAVEALAAGTEAQRFALDAAYVALAANVVGAAIQEAATREQIAAVDAIIEQNRHALEILERQLADGYAMRADVAAQEAQLAQAAALRPPLEKQLEQTRDLLRALVGNLPNQELEETFRLDQLHLPAELPVSVPSALIAQRPDVRAAEALLHAANADVGVAVAARFPQFSITGAVGGTATEFSQMFASGGPFWNLIGGVTQPVFVGGTLLHRQRAAEEGLRQAAAQYQAAVLAAYQDVADTLHAVIADADGLRAAADYETAARVELDVARKQRRAGLIGELVLLQAEQAYQQALISRVQAQGLRFADATALYVALGGGWWQKDAPPLALK